MSGNPEMGNILQQANSADPDFVAYCDSGTLDQGLYGLCIQTCIKNKMT